MPSVTEKTITTVLDHRGHRVKYIKYGTLDALVDEPKAPPLPGNGMTSRQSTRMSLPVAMATGISADDLMPQNTARVTSRAISRLTKSTPTPLQTRRSNSPHLPVYTPKLAPIDPELLGSGSRSADRVSWANDKEENSTHLFSLRPPVPPPPRSRETPPGSSCGHHNAGQELCYLCHQRDHRNVPVSFDEERKKREHEEDQLLQQYHQLRDTENLLREQENYLARRHEQQKIAAFNLGVTEAVKTRKTTKPTDFHPSFIFQNRPLTPPRLIRQRVYANDLSSQVKAKEDLANKLKYDDAFLERLEQVQLAEDLAAQREQYLRDKAGQTDQYKKALSAQVRFKPLPLPARVSDSSEPVFGRNDMSNAAMAERRRRAHDLFRQQHLTVEQRKRDVILKRLNEQKDEEAMLKKTKESLVMDRAQRYEHLMSDRKKLEDEWNEAARLKHEREQHERLHRMQGAQPLLQQTAPYKRCKQCKKKVDNCGESNLWHESRYIPGSRIMV